MAARALIFLAAARQALAASGGSSSKYSVGTSEDNNILYSGLILAVLGALVLAFAVHQLVIATARYIRKLTCLNNEKQIYFARPIGWYGSIKQHLFYAPLIRTRHHREMRLFNSYGVGILPTRFQSLLLTFIIGMNVFFACYGIEWNQAGSSNTLSHFRNRTGTMAVANMIPLILMAGRNNPLIIVLGISFDSFNMMHRWFGRICAALGVTHTIVCIVKDVTLQGGWADVAEGFQTSTMDITGLVAVIAFVVIVIQATAQIRHAFYEFFLHFHITLVITALVALWYHLADSPTKIFVELAIATWIFDRTMRLFWLLYRNVGGNGATQATVETLPGDAVRVTVHLARSWNFKPGQHMYITVPSVGLWTSHPFSAAWSEDTTTASDEKGLVLTNQDVLALPKTTSVSAIIRRREGFTDRLYKKAVNSAEGVVSLAAIVEGPYGVPASLSSYGTVVLFAGGVGITHQVPYLRSLISHFSNGTGAARRVCLIWTIQCPEHLEWIRPWMMSILSLDRRRDILRIQLFVTRPRSAKEIQSPSSTVQMFPGRPNVETVLNKEVENQVGAMAVSVCGAGGLADDVRRAVRKRQGVANIDLIEESFSW